MFFVLGLWYKGQNPCLPPRYRCSWQGHPGGACSRCRRWCCHFWPGAAPSAPQCHSPATQTCTGLGPQARMGSHTWGRSMLMMIFYLRIPGKHGLSSWSPLFQLFPKYSQKHPIARPWGRGMGVFCEFKVWYVQARTPKTAGKSIKAMSALQCNVIKSCSIPSTILCN